MKSLIHDTAYSFFAKSHTFPHTASAHTYTHAENETANIRGWWISEFSPEAGKQFESCLYDMAGAHVPVYLESTRLFICIATGNRPRRSVGSSEPISDWEYIGWSTERESYGPIWQISASARRQFFPNGIEAGNDAATSPHTYKC